MALIPLTPQSFAQAHWLPLQSAAFARTVSLVELNASELPAAPRLKYPASSGSTGCTQYSSEKVAKPARKSARLMRR